MKIKPEHLEHLRQLVTPHDTPEARKLAIEQGHNNMRYRWDCLWAAKQSRWVCDNLYPYINDDHIDTALRRIIPDLNQGV